MFINNAWSTDMTIQLKELDTQEKQNKNPGCLCFLFTVPVSQQTFCQLSQEGPEITTAQDGVEGLWGKGMLRKDAKHIPCKCNRTGFVVCNHAVNSNETSSMVGKVKMECM